jgi:hypothetical protein
VDIGRASAGGTVDWHVRQTSRLLINERFLLSSKWDKASRSILNVNFVQEKGRTVKGHISVQVLRCGFSVIRIFIFLVRIRELAALKTIATHLVLQLRHRSYTRNTLMLFCWVRIILSSGTMKNRTELYRLVWWLSAFIALTEENRLRVFENRVLEQNI